MPSIHLYNHKKVERHRNEEFIGKTHFCLVIFKEDKKVKTSKKTMFLNTFLALLITVILTGDIQHFTVFPEAEKLPEAEKMPVGVDDAE